MISMKVPLNYKPRVIASLVKSFFVRHGYAVDMRAEGDFIHLKFLSNSGLPFLSKQDNYIIMKETSERAKRIKRNYLATSKPTAQQFKLFFNLLEGLCSDLDIVDPVTFDSKVLINNKQLNKTFIKELASGRRFPKSKEETKDVRKEWA